MIDVYCWSNRPKLSNCSIYQLTRGSDQSLYWVRTLTNLTKIEIKNHYQHAFFLDFKHRLAKLYYDKDSDIHSFSFLYEEGDIELSDTEPAPN